MATLLATLFGAGSCYGEKEMHDQTRQWLRRGKESLFRFDYRLLILIVLLMGMSLCVIASTESLSEESGMLFFTARVVKQIKFFFLGFVLFFAMSFLDYQKLRDWTWPFYITIVLLLIGLFFTPAVQNVHRWYKLGGIEFQPSEYAKLALVMALSWFLEMKEERACQMKTAGQALVIVAIPFILILKQPDLGTALVLFPVGLMLFYLGGVNKKVTLFFSLMMASSLTIVALFFLNVIDHEAMKPYATHVLKEYQYERLRPDTYHQKAAQTAIALGGITGRGFGKNGFTQGQWLPAAPTDSVFPAFAEQFGLIGVTLLLGIFYGLTYLGFKVALVAKDRFGRLLASGITTYLAMHVLINIGMMSGFLPITGVPLILISYGGSSVVMTMGALGILQSIQMRRYRFT